MVGILEASRDSDEPGLIALLARDLADGDDSDTSELPRLITLLRELVVAGNETTGKFIAEAVRTFGADASVWDRIRQDPAFAEKAVEEAVRMASPTQHVMRMAAAETDLDGTHVEKGQVVMLSLASANRDEQLFPDPDRFDPDREGLRGHMAFGQGVHACVGAGLARMESVIALQVLAGQVDRIVPSEPAGPYTRSYIIRGPLEMRATVHRRTGR
jgi:cytochrome P450